MFFGRLTEICAQYLRKGSVVYVEGTIHTRKTMMACLRAMGVHYVLGIDGWPRVGREHMNEVLSGKKAKWKTMPNFDEVGA